MAKPNEPPKTEPTTDASAASLPQTTADVDELETLKRRLELERGKNEKLQSKLDQINVAAEDLKHGDVLGEDDTHETVVVRRPKAAKPTGRYKAKHFYRCSPFKGAEDGMLHPGKVYTLLDEKMVEHALQHGAIEPELA